jgi:CRISPR/Cas system-associated protein Cas5 (RAMP superfamily)
MISDEHYRAGFGFQLWFLDRAIEIYQKTFSFPSSNTLLGNLSAPAVRTTGDFIKIQPLE